MDHKQLLKDMKDSIGTKEPIEYFDKLTECFSLLFNKIEKLEEQNHKIKMLAALAVKWDPTVASNLLADQIAELRNNKDLYFDEISKLKQAYTNNKITQDCTAFCTFWKDTLGWHPFTGA